MYLKWSIPKSVLVLLAMTGVAHAEGELNIYNWGNYTNPKLIKKFEEQYKVKVTITDYDSNDTALAKARQGGSGFDIVVPSQTYLPIWIKEGLLLETNPGQMENFKNVMPEWANPDFDPGRKYSVPWAWGTIGVVVNTDTYKGDINTWDIIFKTPDELKGKVNVVPEMKDVVTAAIRYVGGEQCTGDRQVLKKARDLLTAAKPNWIAMEYNAIEKMGGALLVTADHGNAEMMVDPETGGPHTAHTLNPVPLILVGAGNRMVVKEGRLADIAPTLLELMGLPKPAEMTGKSLLQA